MDETQFEISFPDFPTEPEDLQKLGVLLADKKVCSRPEFETLKKENPDPRALLKAVGLQPDLLPRELAEIEANLLGIPFVDIEATQISNDIFKILPIDLMVDLKVIPIKLLGPDLLVGLISPTKATEVFKTLSGKCNLGFKPAKVLHVQWETRIRQYRASTEKKVVVKGSRKRLGDVLVEAKYVSEEILKEALGAARDEKMRLGAYLVKKAHITNKQLTIALSRQFDIPYVDLEDSLLDPVLATLLPKKICYEKTLCPVKREDKKIVIAFTDPTDIITIDHIEMMTGLRVSPVVSSELSIVAALDKIYGGGSDFEDAFGDDVMSGGVEGSDVGEFSEDAAPIIKLVNLFFTQGIQLGVSDIHIECFEKEMRIRFRKDGIMKIFMTSNRAAHPAVVSRIKVMANLDIAETRNPQDGRIKLTLTNKRVDVRVSCVPCVWGEKICMRLCDQGNLKVNLSDLGFEPHVLEKFMEGVESPNGIVLVTGPTGSGKTTTLYSSLFLLNNPAVNISTAEDPVEYNLMGINQTQCHADIGLTFEAALRSFLRQDPDIIMIGEIRDYDTASIAIKAAMTGHLVISTLHTNDAPATVARLLNMGIEPFALTTSIRVVEAQRLVRRICKSCCVDFTAPPDLIKSMALDQRLLEKLRLTDQIDLNNLILSKGEGCPDCDNTGYKGRQGIYEVLVMTDAFRALILRGGGPEEMRRQAIRDGMVTLRESALYKLVTKLTTSEEVVRSTMEGGSPVDDIVEDLEPEAEPGGGSGILVPSQSVAIAGIDELTREVAAFRSAMENLGGGFSTASAIQAEIFKQNLTNPLAQIQKQVKSGLTGVEINKVLPAIQSQGQRMSFNLRNMMAHLSTPELKPIECGLNELAEKFIFSALKDYVMLARLLSGTGTIGSNLKVTKGLANTLPKVYIDLESFQMIAMNLVINSLMAMPKGGEIKILTRVKESSPDHVELAIFDTGTGIPAEKQQSLFTPFVAIGRKTMGLGLAVSKKLITASGGNISLKSNAGKNTLVTLDFPVKGK